MPRGDGTGPAGMGPMTGRAAGYCAGYETPGYMNPVGGRGGFRGRGPGFGGGGWGRRNWYYATGQPGWARAAQGMPAWGDPGAAAYPPPYASGYQQPTPDPEQEKQALRQQAEYLQQSLDEINERLEQLEKQESKE